MVYMLSAKQYITDCHNMYRLKLFEVHVNNLKNMHTARAALGFRNERIKKAFRKRHYIYMYSIAFIGIDMHSA